MVLLFPVTSLLLLFINVYFLTSLVAPQTNVAKIVTAYVMVNAQLVLIATVLSLVLLIDDPRAWLAMQLIFSAVSGLVWWKKGKPGLNFPGLNSILARGRQMIRENSLLLFLLTAVTLAYVIGAFMILYVPPNNYDGMTYRLPRIMYWLQDGGIWPFDTANLRQTTFPPNAEIGILYTFLLAGSDILAGFVQWFAALMSAVTIFGFGRLLKFDRTRSALTALLFLTLTQIQLQSTTIQNDLVVGAFFTIGLYLFYIGIERRHLLTLAVSAIALSLALGTKFTAPLILPGFALAVLIHWLRDPRRDFRLYATWAAFCVSAFIFFGSYIYVTNVVWYDSPTGPSTYASRIMDAETTRTDLLLSNIPRYLISFLDFSSIPRPLGESLHTGKHEIFEGIFSGLHPETIDIQNPRGWRETKEIYSDPNEDYSWFGLLGFFVYLPGLAYGVIRSIRDPQNRTIWLGFVIIFLTFFLVHSAFQAYTPFKSRYYVLPISATAIVMIWLFADNTLIRVYKSFMLIIVIVTLTSNVLYFDQKPLGYLLANPEPDREDRRMIHIDHEYWWGEINDRLQNEAVVGLVGSGNTWEYPLFGPSWQRMVIPFVPDKEADEINLMEAGIIPDDVKSSLTGLGTEEERFDFLLVDLLLRQTIVPEDYVLLFTTSQRLGLYQLPDSMEAVSSVKLDFDVPVTQDDWSVSRNIDGQSVQWMRDDEAAIEPFKLSESENGYQLRYIVPNTVLPAVRQATTVLLNDHSLDVQHDGTSTTAYIPPDLIDTPDEVVNIKFVLDSDRAYEALGFDSANRPPLEFGLDQLTIEPIVERVFVDFDGQYENRGWNPVQYNDENPFRWTSQARSDLILPVYPTTNLRVSFHVTNMLTNEAIEKLTMNANGREIPIELVWKSDGVYGHGVIDVSHMNNEQLHIVFETIEPMSPQSINSESTDERLLGLAFDALYIQPITDPVTYEFTGDAPTRSGWESPEIYEGVSFQWTNETNSTLAVPYQSACDSEIQFVIAHTMVPDTLENLDLIVNGEQIALEREFVDGKNLYTGTIPAQQLEDELQRITFAVDEVLSAKDVDPQLSDTRQLGVALDWLTLNPTADCDRAQNE